jgi:hypothetical protein
MRSGPVPTTGTRQDTHRGQEDETLNVPRGIQQELEKRDDLILALEMLTVDQACRLLALEAVMRELVPAKKKFNAKKIDAYIESAADRFRQHFEGESVDGFTDRAKRIAAELTGT